MPRYIDADKIKQELLAEDAEIGKPENLEMMLKSAGIFHALIHIQLAEAEDVAPVIHAHWKEYVDVGGAIYIECSACGLIWWLDEGTAEENEMFYCPKCGAKMDEKEGNE